MLLMLLRGFRICRAFFLLRAVVARGEGWKHLGHANPSAGSFSFYSAHCSHYVVMQGTIDYSKWDHLDEYSDDDDQDIGDQTAPRVTRLDGPSQVTFGGDGGASISPPQPVVAAAADPPKPTGESVSNSPAVAAKGDPYQSWKASGGVETTTADRRLFWSQDRYSVCIRLELAKEEKINSIEVKGAVSYANRFCAVGTAKPKLIVHSTDMACLVDGELPHPVHFAQDEDEIEWSVERSSSDERFLAITLYKAVPMQDLSIWWRRPLMSFDEIELGKDSNKTSKDFQNAWEEAHRLFREKKRSSG
jgi:hypothetical protein